MAEESTGRVIGQFGSSKSPLIIKLDEFKGRRVLDIRRYFTDKESKELQPTKKGLSITSGVFKSLEEIAYRYGNEIRAWLTDPANNNHSLVRRSEALENCNNEGQEFEVRFDEWRGNTFFLLKTEGAVNIITFNEKHPYIVSIKERKSPEDVLKAMAAVIISFKRASYRFDDLDYNYPALFDSLEYEWGNLLKSYSQGE